MMKRRIATFVYSPYDQVSIMEKEGKLTYVSSAVEVEGPYPLGKISQVFQEHSGVALPAESWTHFATVDNLDEVVECFQASAHGELIPIAETYCSRGFSLANIEQLNLTAMRMGPKVDPLLMSLVCLGFASLWGAKPVRLATES